jgi:hypothetical protein
VSEGTARAAPRKPPAAIVMTPAPMPSARQCQFPLWNGRVTHEYCGRRAVVRSYCAEHASVCYLRLPLP